VKDYLARGLKVADWLALPQLDKHGNFVLGEDGKPMPISGSRYNGRRAAVSSWFKYKGKVVELPECRDRKRKPRTILNEDEIGKIMVEWEKAPLRERAIANLIYASGVRPGEARGALLERLDLDERCLYVEGKGGDWREVMFDEYTATLLAAYIRLERVKQTVRGPQRIFTSNRGKGYRDDVMIDAFRAAAERAGVEKAATCDRPAHLYRRCFTTHRLANGESLEYLQEHLGHQSILTTRGYVGLDRETRRKRFDEYAPRAQRGSNEVRRRA
jgi:site-specific recombinase XerD